MNTTTIIAFRRARRYSSCCMSPGGSARLSRDDSGLAVYWMER